MFSYYGTKARLAAQYPAPEYDTVIEPFAGAAGYACLHFEKQVKLFDANPKVAAVWKWLIAANKADVMALPDVEVGDSLADHATLSDAERWLIGFCINPASSMPKVTASKRSAWGAYKKRIAEDVARIKHWTVECRSWTDVPNEVATWYVDPPYEDAGKYYYGYSAIYFDILGLWCKQRRGQVIVCENLGADWLPFYAFVQQKGMSKTQTEAIWLKNDSRAVQLEALL